MTERLSRKMLYDLVWSEPLKNLSARFGISDVGLKKTCERAEIPTPDRGYWAKKEARKETFQAELPMRPPGMDDEVSIASGGNGWYQRRNEEEILGFVGAPPQFDESTEALRTRIAETIEHVAVPKRVQMWHSTRLIASSKRIRARKELLPIPIADIGLGLLYA